MELEKIFSKNNVKLLSNVLFGYFIEKQSKISIDYDFSISHGVMKSGDKNTFVIINSEKNDELDSLFNELKSYVVRLEKNNKKTDMDKFYNELSGFMEKVKKDFNKQDFKGISDCFRKKVLNNAEPFLFPLNNIRLCDIEVNLSYDKEVDSGYTLQVNKLVNQDDIDEDGKSINKKSIANELIQESMQTGRRVEELYQEKKLSGHPDYENVTGIEKKYYEGEFNLSFFVDYSPAPFEEVKKYMMKG